MHGRLIAAGDALDASYWNRQILGPVRFEEALQAVVAHGVDGFLEIGARTDLVSMGRLALQDPEEYLWRGSLRPGRGEWETLLDSLGALYVAGAEVDWRAFDRGYARERVELPTYPFQRSRHWVRLVAAAPVLVAPAASGGAGEPEQAGGGPVIAPAPAGAPPRDALRDRVLEAIASVCGQSAGRLRPDHNPVSYTHLTLPTIYPV